jgi:putative endopeptidase
MTKKNKTSKSNKTNKNKTRKTREIPIKSASYNTITKRAKNKCPEYHPYIKFEEDYSGHLDPKKLIKTNLASKTEFVEKLKIEFAPSKITPQSDFYSYINYKWITNVKEDDILKDKQKYITQIDVYRLLQDKVYNNINNIIDDYVKNNDTLLSENVRNFSNSALNLSSIKESRNSIKKFIDYLDHLRNDKKNVWKLLAHLNKIDMIKSKCPFVWNLVADKKDSKKFVTEIAPHFFELIQIEGLMTSKEYSKQLYQHNYLKHLKTLFKTCIPDKSANYKDAFDVLIEMMAAFDYNELPEDENGYNIISVEEADEKYGFNVSEFLKEMGYTEIPSKVVCTSLNYLKYGTALMVENWDSEKWRSYWIWIYTTKVSRCTRKWSSIYYEYYGKELRGQQIRIDKFTKRAIFTSVVFNKLISYEYIDKFVDPTAVNMIRDLADDLRIVFKKMITRCYWLIPKTRELSLEKLDALKFMLVRPDNMADDPPSSIRYSNTDLWNNLVKYSNWRTQYIIGLANKPVTPFPVVDWTEYPVKFVSYQPFIVNSEYIQSLNTIYIPAGIIQAPFIDLSRPVAFNLATIGFVIAHELSHSLDDNGSKYDKNGNLKDWWTVEDKKNFLKIQKDIIKQYEDWTRRDGIKFDAEQSIGEDIADISAISICGDFLKNYLTVNKYEYPNQLLNFRLFYNLFASHIRQKISKRSLKSQLIINPHPPDKYRCNVPLSRSIVFRTVYNVKKGDKMWWHSLNQVW